MRKLSLVIAGILGAGSPLISQAATLGQAEVQSYLSEPLEVRVPLMRSSGEPLDEITVQLAPPSFYREAGVPLTNLSGNLTFAIESEGGQDYVLVGSKRPIRDPILSLLLEVQSPQGRMIRSYNLLLDPPAVAPSPSKAEAAPAREASRQALARSAPAPRATGQWQRVEPAENLSLDSSRKVERGDTLSEIASDYVGEGENVRSVMQAIIDANPHAFANGNGNTMLAGVELKVPSAPGETEQAVPSEVADGETSQQGPALELLSPAEGEQRESADLGGFGELSRDTPLPAIAGAEQPATPAMDPDDALAQEELESVKAENEALTEQLRSLKEEIDSVKVAVDERDARIADLKDVVEESRQQAEQAQARQETFWVQWGKYLTGAMGLLIIALLIALGLRRSRHDDEPAVPMPATADTAAESRGEQPSIERNMDKAGASAAAVGGAAVGGALAGQESNDPATAEPGVDDPMNPEMALEEARVLESFNLTHQALELLQESLEEHPGHAGLQAAINRLSGIEQQAETVDVEEDEGVEAAPEASATDSAEADHLVSADETAGEPSIGDTQIEADRQAEREEVGGAPSETSEPSGEIAWDEDFDDMLATPEPESARGSDDNLMEFDDSFALETPSEEQDASEARPDDAAEPDDTLIDLSEGDASTAGGEGEEKGAEDELDALDLDLSGYQPAGETAEAKDEATGTTEDEGLELGMAPEPEEEPAVESTSEADNESEVDVDTRVSLAEAFLDVGDRESFDMIEAELREEGATAALQRLDELKQRYDS
ncbi:MULTISPECIES: hypothetical protein [unclassified Guyparkeria]|uniref:type IV pilus assembly protein FimV n=1 Tax=unclassified Guyparkeria TaxID=2626246 RepID=UPI00073372F5|nr:MULTISPECIES: hypothetical protein [unclassified Guyparkeria]KTG17768.1 hypothetical protein AUR63_06510 [Guyparkeria sp. XI15]OAE89479.1 hypothetical protein AWR35_06520 [Guyparkeria sp. WRN-7]